MRPLRSPLIPHQFKFLSFRGVRGANTETSVLPYKQGQHMMRAVKANLCPTTLNAPLC